MEKETVAQSVIQHMILTTHQCLSSLCNALKQKQKTYINFFYDVGLSCVKLNS